MYDPTDTLETVQTKRDEYWVYITGEINPFRESIGRAPLTREKADECFKIIYDFEKNMAERRIQWEKEQA